MTLKEHFNNVLGRDLRAAFADVLGYSVLSPDQERHIEAIQASQRVVAWGASGCGKTFIQGGAAALLVATSKHSKCLFGAVTESQAMLLSWLEMQRALMSAQRRGFDLAGPGCCGVATWYPLGKTKVPDWFATCMALSDRNNATSVQGILHGSRVCAVFDEVEGIPQVVLDAIDTGTTQDNAHLWLSFNPVNKKSAAGTMLFKTPEDGRVNYSAIRLAEWKARYGIIIPGTPTVETLEERWVGRENDPLYYTKVIGDFPPGSAEDVVIPQDWFNMCVNCIPQDEDARVMVALGVDTGAGKAENIIASCRGRIVSIDWASREQHETPKIFTAVKDVERRYPSNRVVVVVDYLGRGGKGLGDDLAAGGYHVLPFIGGGREFAGVKEAGIFANVVTWAWFSVKDAVRLTVQAIKSGRPERYISFPDDPILREQFARPFTVTGEKRYRLSTKSDMRESPDRADAVAMAWLAGTAVCRPVIERKLQEQAFVPDFSGDSSDPIELQMERENTMPNTNTIGEGW